MELSREKIEKELSDVSDEIELIDRMNNYSSMFFRSNDLQGDELAIRALSLARASFYSKGIAQALLNRALFTYKAGDYETMFSYLIESEEILRTLPDGKAAWLDRVLNCKAIYYMNKGNYNEAIGIFEEALQVSQETGNMTMYGNIYSNLSRIYSDMGHTHIALEYCLKALDVLKTGNSKIAYIWALDNAAIFCNDLNEFSRALGFLDIALERSEELQIVECRAVLLCTYAKVFMKMGEFGKAEENLQASLELASNYPEVQILDLKTLGKLYLELNKPGQAEAVLKNALEVEKHCKRYIEAKEIYKLLETVYMQKEDYKNAHYYLQLSSSLEKQLFDKEMTEKMRSLETEMLRQTNQRIKVMSEVGRKITSTLDMRGLLDLIYTHVNTFLDAAVFGIARLNRELNRIEFDMFVEDGIIIDPFYRPLDAKNSLAALAIKEKKEIIISDFDSEYHLFLPIKKSDTGGLEKGVKEQIPQSIFCCPLISSGEVTGVIMVQSYEKNAYTVSDLDSLKVLASYVAVALQNAFQSELIKQQNSRLSKANVKLTNDIQLSRELQLAMIPLDFPKSPMYKIYGYFNFLDEVGGDLYDVYRISPEKTVILILDVVGHGVSAALVTAMAKILFYNKAKEHLCASSIVEEVNRDLTNITGDSFTFFSLFFGIIDEKNRTLQYVNAAHPEPFLLKNETEPVILTAPSLFVGLKKDYSYDQNTIGLDKGDRLVLFTDGFFELRCPDSTRFGEKRLLDAMIRSKSLEPDRAVEQLIGELDICRCKDNDGTDDDKMILIVDFF